MFTIANVALNILQHEKHVSSTYQDLYYVVLSITCSHPTLTHAHMHLLKNSRPA